MQSSLLGPEFSDDEIEAVLRAHGAVFQKLEGSALLDFTVDLLKAEKVVGWFQGRMEFGPRALGNRSILGDARSPQHAVGDEFEGEIPRVVPAVRARSSAANAWPIILNWTPNRPTCCWSRRSRAELRKPLPADVTGLDLLKAERSTLPAITHVDYSARIQTVAPA